LDTITKQLPHQVFDRVGQNPEQYSDLVPGLCEGLWYAQTPQGLWLELREGDGNTVLTLWGCKWAAKNRSERGYPHFRLFAGTREETTWDSGRGSQFSEPADFEIHQVSIRHKGVIKDILLILATILELGDNVDLGTLCQSEVLVKA